MRSCRYSVTRQAGFGFAPVALGPLSSPRVVRLGRGGLFWMVEDGSGWRPLLEASASAEDAIAAAVGRFSGAVVRVVDSGEVGR